MKLSTPGMVSLLSRTRPQPASIITRTPVELLKGGRSGRPVCPYPQGSIWRLAERLGMVGVDYAKCVNNQRDREGGPLVVDDDPAADSGAEVVEQFYADRLWNGQGKRVNDCLVKHVRSGRLYLVFFPRLDLVGQPIILREQYERTDGRKIAKDKFRPWLPAVRGEGTKRQQTAKPIAWRLIEVSHIVQIKVGGNLYQAA